MPLRHTYRHTYTFSLMAILGVQSVKRSLPLPLPPEVRAKILQVEYSFRFSRLKCYGKDFGWPYGDQNEGGRGEELL